MAVSFAGRLEASGRGVIAAAGSGPGPIAIPSSLTGTSLGVTIGQFLKHDPVMLYANVEAFNRWVDDEWGFHRDDRIIAAAKYNLDHAPSFEEFSFA